MLEIIILEIIVGVFLLVWTVINYKENSGITKRWQALVDEEEKRENTFKRIKSVTVNKTDGGKDVVSTAKSWNLDDNFLYLFNSEDKAVAIYPTNAIKEVYFEREVEPTHD